MIINTLMDKTFLTGSRAFGTARPDSDYDLVVSIEHFQGIKNEIAEQVPAHAIHPSSYFAGEVLWWCDGHVMPNSLGELSINLIPVHPESFKPWYLATLAMAATCKEAGFTNAVHKYAAFEAMVAAFKARSETHIGGCEHRTAMILDICKRAQSHPSQLAAKNMLAQLTGFRNLRISHLSRDYEEGILF